MIQGHGGNIFGLAEQLGCRPEEIVDMSSNINPLGTLPGLIEHLRGRMDRISALPEVDARSAARAIAALLGVAEERVLAGGGTTQFIYAACAALASRKVLIVGPTYADYADGCRVCGIEPDFFLAGAAHDFALDVERLAAALPGYDTVFLCNANNPTGHLVDHGALLALCTRHPRVRFVIDESYLPFAPADRSHSMSGCGLDNVAVLWSVSKIFGMPGLRAGFLVANTPAIDRFRRLMQPWSMNSLAQEAVCFLGTDPEAVAAFIDRTRAYLAEEGRRFRQRLQTGRLILYPSATSYVLIGLPADRTATTVCRALAEQRFLIRNCANFYGLDEGFIRIALKDATVNETVARHLLAAVGEKK
ncbi:MAG: aminotransferase class I/II-fold pyridoxal phosphate-dependent enzyme [Desulfobulbus sp.]|jgi:threonine-phosphate decarboxylase|uniref:pyridoxal phosphate-dependent aminotransferase n=1 Tax=Desulfobulbus sp. TaxID=895 RepID=UPI002843B2C1|nr:aminotransferase class I/II-fold pyridoxal phosphate-dependent enzyme [Desulfobulbus sp.]MDR2551343.1 aminotransferase class I/II-fold pyridoxal phosphate-dependent enzyme [Desulfobulbus sp.]